MRRRDFLALAAAWPAGAHAQQRDVRKLAVLMGAAPAETGQSYIATFFSRLEELGWARGRNIRIETRWWDDNPERMQAAVSELMAFTPDVVMVFSNLALAQIKPKAGAVPLVFVGVGDPVGGGFVSDIAHPGGTITGFAGTDGPIGGKWLEVLKETVPQLRRVLAVMHSETAVHQAFWRSMEAAGPRFGVEVVAGSVRDAANIESAVASFATKEDGGVIVFPHAITWANEKLLIELGLRHRLPSHYATAASVKAGGLVSYGHDFEDSFRKTAEYVDRILRGEKAGDLPVQQPTKFKLVFNLKTAKAINLTVPALLLARADEVTE